MALSFKPVNPAPPGGFGPPPPMMQVPPPPVAALPPAAALPADFKIGKEFDFGKWSAGDAAAALLTKYAQYAVPQPLDALPRLTHVPNELDLLQANNLHVQASRWLEHVHTKITTVELQHILYKGEAAWRLKTLKFKYKDKIERATEEEFDQLRAVEVRALELEAELVSVNGIKRSLDEVLAAASRTITRHTKTNQGFSA